MTAHGVGTSLSPDLGGFIAQQFGFRAAFALLGALSLGALAIWLGFGEMLRRHSTVVPSNAKPPVANNNKLRPRARNGSGRSLRGTVQAVFIAFCNACAPPSPP